MARLIAPGMFQNPLRKELNVPSRTSYSDARLFLLNADFAVEFPMSLPPIYKVIKILVIRINNFSLILNIKYCKKGIFTIKCRKNMF